MYTEGTSTVISSLYLGNRAFIYYYLQLTAVKQVSQLTTGSLRYVIMTKNKKTTHEILNLDQPGTPLMMVI